MKKILWLGLLLMTGCGSVALLDHPSLLSQQPQVVSVTPLDGEENYLGNSVEVIFNRPIDPETLTAKSFAITAVAEGEVDVQDLWKKAKKGELKSVVGEFEISEDQTTVHLTTEEPFPPEIRCGVLITPEVFSTDRLPLNQTPGEGPTPFFSSFYAGGDLIPSTLPAASDLPAPSYLMLNEIFYDAAGSDTNGDLFIELLGEPERSLAGYQILLIRGDDGVILDSVSIPQGMQTNTQGFFVIADAVTGQKGVTHVDGADWVTNFDPPNGPDCIQLLDPAGNLVDALGYGEPLVLRAKNDLFCYETAPAPDAPSGSSLTRLPNSDDTDNNSFDWIVPSALSPGEHSQEQ